MVGYASASAQPGSKAWNFSTGGAILSSPAVASNGTIYVGSYDQRFYAINPDGTLRWSRSLAPAQNNEAVYVFSAPALGPDGTVYFGTEHRKNHGAQVTGEFYAVDPVTGTPQWVKTFSGAVYSDPAVAADGTVYVGCYDTNLYAFHPNGTEKWRFRTGDQIYSDPVLGADGTIYVGCDDGQVYALNPNGTLRWTFTTGTRAITASPALGEDGTLYVGVGSVYNPRFYSISPNGATNWVFLAGHQINSSAAIGADGTIFFGCNDRRLYALNPNGTKKWEFVAGSAVRSSPALAADGSLYFGCDDDRLYALDSSGAGLWTFVTSGSVYSSPAVVSANVLYVGSSDNSLYAVRTLPGLAAAPWPMFRQNIQHTARRQETAPNQPPVLASISDQIISEGAVLSLTNSATDPDGDLPAFSLDPGAPAGAGISATTGIFTWTPTEADGPGSVAITVRVTDNGSPPLSDTRTFTVMVQEVNTAPTLTAIDDQTAVEGAALTLTGAATDSDLPANTLTFSLEPGAPAGASIDATTGVFNWIPTEADGPGSADITVRVTDNGSPSLSVTKTFTAMVGEVNAAPTLAPLGDQTVTEGTKLTLTVTATDPDLPANTLTFSLGPDAPAGAGIDATTGVLTWTPTEGPSTNQITVLVSDNGLPPQSARTSLRVFVLTRPILESVTIRGGTATITWRSIVGRTYRVQSKPALDTEHWMELSEELTALDERTSWTESVDATHRFYRVVLIR